MHLYKMLKLAKVKLGMGGWEGQLSPLCELGLFGFDTMHRVNREGGSIQYVARIQPSCIKRNTGLPPARQKMLRYSAGVLAERPHRPKMSESVATCCGWEPQSCCWSLPAQLMLTISGSRPRVAGSCAFPKTLCAPGGRFGGSTKRAWEPAED